MMHPLTLLLQSKHGTYLSSHNVDKIINDYLKQRIAWVNKQSSSVSFIDMLELQEKPKEEWCQYKGCSKKADIGFYCWEHNPYYGMYNAKEEEKRRKHYEKPTPKPELKLEKFSLDQMNIYSQTVRMLMSKEDKSGHIIDSIRYTRYKPYDKVFPDLKQCLIVTWKQRLWGAWQVFRGRAGYILLTVKEKDFYK